MKEAEHRVSIDGFQRRFNGGRGIGVAFHFGAEAAEDVSHNNG